MRVSVPSIGFCALTLLVLVDCQQDPAVARTADRPVETVRRAALDAATEDSRGDAPGSLLANPIPPGVPVLDEDKLARFGRCQRQIVAINLELSTKAKALLGGGDGGGATAGGPVVAMVQDQNTARARARADSGLTEAELDGIDHMVREILSRRALSKTVDQDFSAQQMEHAMGQLPPEQRSLIKDAVRHSRERAALKSLIHERLHFGDRNVDLVLVHESELRGLLTATNQGPPGM